MIWFSNKWTINDFNNHVSEIHKTSLNSAFVPTYNVTVKEVNNLRCKNVLSIDTVSTEEIQSLFQRGKYRKALRLSELG